MDCSETSPNLLSSCWVAWEIFDSALESSAVHALAASSIVQPSWFCRSFCALVKLILQYVLLVASKSSDQHLNYNWRYRFHSFTLCSWWYGVLVWCVTNNNIALFSILSMVWFKVQAISHPGMARRQKEASKGTVQISVEFTSRRSQNTDDPRYWSTTLSVMRGRLTTRLDSPPQFPEAKTLLKAS